LNGEVIFRETIDIWQFKWTKMSRKSKICQFHKTFHVFSFYLVVERMQHKTASAQCTNEHEWSNPVQNAAAMHKINNCMLQKVPNKPPVAIFG
jgi:hypothetical protein